MNIGIVGSEAAKFTPETERAARDLIRRLLLPATMLVSGGCHLGGIDIYAEEVADELGIPKLIFRPDCRRWEGYAARNILIAEGSDVVHCITIRDYPPTYTGMKFSSCYHCKTKNHVKSGGCWTVKHAKKIGRQGEVHVL